MSVVARKSSVLRSSSSDFTSPGRTVDLKRELKLSADGKKRLTLVSGDVREECVMNDRGSHEVRAPNCWRG